LAALDRVIARCLQPNPAVRPAAHGVLAALDGLALGAGIDGVESLGVSNPPLRPDDARVEYDGDATTIARGKRLDDPIPDRVPVPVPVPPRPPAGRRRIGPAIGVASVIVAGLAIVAVLAVLAFRPESSGRPQASPVTTVAQPTVAPDAGPPTDPRPGGLAPLTAADWSAGGVGDCLVQTAAAELAVTDCEQAHDLQRYAAGALAGELAATGGFDADAVAAAVTAACAEALPGFVGSSADDTTLDLAHTRPNRATWTVGDRAYACYLGRTDSRIIGDARTSGW
jgi:hypothetical protein